MRVPRGDIRRMAAQAEDLLVLVRVVNASLDEIDELPAVQVHVPEGPNGGNAHEGNLQQTVGIAIGLQLIQTGAKRRFERRGRVVPHLGVYGIVVIGGGKAKAFVFQHVLHVRHVVEPALEAAGRTKSLGPFAQLLFNGVVCLPDFLPDDFQRRETLRPPGGVGVDLLQAVNGLGLHVHVGVGVVVDGVAVSDELLQVVDVRVFQSAADQEELQLDAIAFGNVAHSLQIQLGTLVDLTLAMVPLRRPVRKVGGHLDVEGETESEFGAIGIHVCVLFSCFAQLDGADYFSALLFPVRCYASCPK